MKRNAFTLIEISIVLIIIGIILASVMGGRDLVKNSQVKEFTQTFVNQWITIVDSYYTRKGNNICDGNSNGGRPGLDDSDSFFDGTNNNNWNNDNTLQYDKIESNISAVGIDICGLIKTNITFIDDGTSYTFCPSKKNPFRKSIAGEFVGEKAVTVHFTNYTINGKRKNILIFANIPGDVAKAIDTIKDGYADGERGKVIALPFEQDGGGIGIDYGDNLNILNLEDMNELFRQPETTPGDDLTPVAWEHNQTHIMGIFINH